MASRSWTGIPAHKRLLYMVRGGQRPILDQRDEEHGQSYYAVCDKRGAGDPERTIVPQLCARGHVDGEHVWEQREPEEPQCHSFKLRSD